MLIRFRVENHRSIKDEQEISFVAAPLKDSPEKTTSVEKYGLDLLRVAGIYGANASGKSTVLDALQFMRRAVIDSHRKWVPNGGIPRKPFLLDASYESKQSLFEVDILLNETRYTYGFIIDSTEVHEEWLYAYPEGRRQRWFVRDTSQSTEYTFSRFLSGDNKTIRGLTRSNSLFLSAAAQNNHPVLSPVFQWFHSEVNLILTNYREVLPSFTALMLYQPKYEPLIRSILEGSDIGFAGIDVNKDLMTNQLFSTSLRELISKEELLPEEVSTVSGEILARPLADSLSFLHTGVSGAAFPIPFSDESQGTKAFVALIGMVIIILEKGGLLCIDELDSSLHPDMAMEIVRWFNDPKRNPNNAQLLFNTHDTNIMENELRRDQIWFTQKDQEGATHLYSLSDFKTRKDENIKRGYLQGRYGAVPFIRIPELVSSGKTDGEA